MGYAISDNARLARASAGKNEKRAFGGLDGFELFWVEAFHVGFWFLARGFLVPVCAFSQVAVKTVFSPPRNQGTKEHRALHRLRPGAALSLRDLVATICANNFC
jgi:hypothetical protein